MVSTCRVQVLGFRGLGSRVAALKGLGSGFRI